MAIDSKSEAREFSRRKLAIGAAVYLLLLITFWLIASFFKVKAVADYPISTTLGFALLFAPYWLFGFGLGPALRKLLPAPAMRIAASVLFVVPYFVLAIPRGTIEWVLASELAGIAFLVSILLEYAKKPGNWADLLILSALGIIVDLRFLHTASLWPGGLGGFPKLILADIALYGYLVIKPVNGIGYDLQPKLVDLGIGLREFLFYAPFVIPLGLWLGFLHPHAGLPSIAKFAASWIFTYVFVALPEELFFRGLVQNLLERKLGKTGALFVASILFGLSHFNKGNAGGAVFNWRYVLLATIAGIFYGRAWRAQRRLFASGITHASVDTVWSLWFR